ncbi:sugar ABC transporter permease [Spirochaetia bacterium]|nr:sugar ABC transporter permease [Spirochaetia bacterium]
MTSLNKEKKAKDFRRYIPLMVMCLPGVMYLVINNYLPMAGLVIAFKEYNYAKGIFGSDWIGFKNFEFLFRTHDAFVITRNTVLYNILFIIINTCGAIIVAILLSEVTNTFLLRIYQTVILLPYLISIVIVSYLVYAFLSTDVGFINKTVLPALGREPISWYMEAKYWPGILPIVNFWKGVGFTTIIYLSSIVGIDRTYYEAAELDGASKIQSIKNITLPLITPVITIMLLLSVGRIFYSDFGLFYQVPMNSGAIYATTNVIDTYVYRGLMVLNNIGMAAAAGLYQSIVGFLLVIGSNLLVRKASPENALF